MTELSPQLQRWKSGGQFARVDESHDPVSVFYRVSQPSQSTVTENPLPWLVCFHGFPTSSWDWHRLLPLLDPDRRVLVFDFPGYGLSEKPHRRDYSLLRQLDAAESLFNHLEICEFDLLAHDMGNSVACELLRRREQPGYPFSLRSLTLLNGGIYMDLHQPLPTQRLLRTPVLGPIVARFSSWHLFRHQYPRVYANPQSFDEQHYRDQWSLLLNNHGRRSLAGIAGYMRERVRMGEQWTGPLHRLDLPLKLIWGRKDPIAVHAIAEKLVAVRPQTTLVSLDDVGHYPQLEAPEAMANLLTAD